MYKIGIYYGKFIPPHRGHLYQIIEASTKCEKLYVIVCDNPHETQRVCEEAGLPPIHWKLRKQWLAQQLQDIDHIKLLILDEGALDIPEYPNGWDKWYNALIDLVDREGDGLSSSDTAIFVGERHYKDKIETYDYHPIVELFDPSRSRYPISGTEIRQNPMKHWDYILGPVRPWFCKKVLIVGTESCGKTTLTKYLSKLYNTSWSDEVGRYYAQRYLGGDETIFTDEDFTRIAHQQVEQDYHALRTANRVCFFDTDATVTSYYSELYMGHKNPMVDMYIDPSKWDLVIYLSPDVEWVSDGQRLNGDQATRENLNDKLLQMFYDRGFGDNLQVVSGDYNARLHAAIDLVDNLIKED